MTAEKQKRTIFSASIIVVLLLIAPGACTPDSNVKIRPHGTPPQAAPAVRSDLVIAAVGDIMMSGSIQSAVQKNGCRYDMLFERIAGDLRSADIALANLETPVDQELAMSGYPKFNARPELLTALKAAGIRIVSVANNHIMDAGVEGLKRTLDNVEAAGLTAVGAGRTKREASKFAVVPVRGFTVAFLAYTYDVNRRLPGNKPMSPGVNVIHVDSSLELARAAESVRLAKSSAEVVVVSLHWGDEYATTPTAWQRLVAAELVDAGADVLIGHHPHVLQPIETVFSRDGHRGIVAFSLGNFLSSQNAGVVYEHENSILALRGDGIILSIVIGREAGKAVVRRAEFLPIWTLRERNKTSVVPRPVSIAREISKLVSTPKRSREQETLLKFLNRRQQLITDKLAVNVL